MIATTTANPGDREPAAAPLLTRLRAAQKRRTVTGTSADVDGIPVKSSWARLSVPGI